MKDIAAMAGVSRMAVSAVLMGTGEGRVRVAPETAERIRRIASDLGYRPNLAAQQLAGHRSGMIAVVANNWKNFLTQRALAWLHEAAEPAGLRMLASYGQHGVEPVARLVRDVNTGWIDGLVYLAHENESQWSEVSELIRGVPRAVVAIGDLRSSGVSAVVSEVSTGARASIAHLADHGRSRPVFVTEENQSIAIRTRIAEYVDVAEQRGLHFTPSQIVIETCGWIVSDPAYYPKFDELARLLVVDERADCILCDTDFTAVGLLRAFRRLGIRVPDDVAVVGWGDLQFAALFDPPLTTVSHELPELLARVVSRLTCGGVSAQESVLELIPTRLIMREST